MAWTFIQHLSSPTSDQFNFTSLSLSSYQRILLVLDGLTVGTDQAFIDMLISTASTLRTTGYRYQGFNSASDGGSNTWSNNAASLIGIGRGTTSGWGVGNASGETLSARIFINNCTASVYKQTQCDASWVASSGVLVRSNSSGLLEQTGSIDGLRVQTSTGTLPSGKATLYGLPTS